MNRKRKILTGLLILFIIILGILFLESCSNTEKSISANSTAVLSTKKICWGIKRNDNNEQPDLGTKNKELIDKYNGIAIRKCR